MLWVHWNDSCGSQLLHTAYIAYRIAGKVGGSYIWQIRYFCCLAEFNLAVAQSETPYVWGRVEPRGAFTSRTSLSVREGTFLGRKYLCNAIVDSLA